MAAHTSGMPPTSNLTPVAPLDIWRDPANPPAVRAEALLAVMTLDEKIGQMTQLQTRRRSIRPASPGCCSARC